MKKFKKNYFIIIILIFITGCSDRVKTTILFDKMKNCEKINDSILSEKKKISSPFDSAKIKKIKSSIIDFENSIFYKEYINSITLDTSFINVGNTISIKHKVIDKYYWLPKELDYLEGGRKEIYQTRTEIKIDNRTFVIVGDSFSFIAKYNPIVSRYGILIAPEVFWDTGNITIEYSYSIPFTDLGYHVKAILNLKTYSLSFFAEL